MDKMIKKIQENYDSFTKAKRKTAEYVVEHYQEIPFETAETLALKIGVSGSTVVNFCIDLGFEGFGDFKKKIKEFYRVSIPWSSKFQHQIETAKEDNIYLRSYDTDIHNINKTMQNRGNLEALEKLMEYIEKSETIYIVGVRSSAILAQYLANAMGQQGYNTAVITPGIDDPRLRVMRMTEKDLLISISFASYARDTLDIVNLAYAEGIPHFSFTDSKISPMAIKSVDSLICELSSYHSTPSLASCIVIINAILAGFAQRNPKRVKERLDSLEAIYKGRDLYR